MPANPSVPVFQKTAPPGTPLPAPDLSDMDRIHRAIRGDRLADVLEKIVRGRRKK